MAARAARGARVVPQRGGAKRRAAALGATSPAELSLENPEFFPLFAFTSRARSFHVRGLGRAFLYLSIYLSIFYRIYVNVCRVGTYLSSGA